MPNASAKADQDGMKSAHEELTARTDALRFRASALREVRAYFDGAGFCETETPVAIKAPAAEEYIEAPPAGDSLFLRSSPELELKRLVCAGMERIYELGPCFRMNESGRLHRSEFTMLEFYMAHTSYIGLMDFMREMLSSVAVKLNGTTETVFRGTKFDFGKDWEIISVREAFRMFAGGKSPDELAKQEGLFELVLCDEVEPRLPKDRPCALVDYPVRFGAFARAKEADPTLVERWEVYCAGVELANTYGELTDARIQRERFAEFAETRRRNGLAEYPRPDEFLEAMDHGMCECSGSALGFDRLVMLLAGKDSISEVSFPL